LFASKFIGVRILQGSVSSPDINNCFSKSDLSCAKLEREKIGSRSRIGRVIFIA
jgi:hypothetical protein